MLKKLRIKFIVITMISVFLILTAIMVSVNVVNYISVMRSTDEVVDYLSQNEGKFPFEMRDKETRDMPPKQEQNPPPSEQPTEYPEDQINENDGKVFRLPPDMSAETPFDTRYFTVTFSGDTITESNLELIAAVSEEDAKNMASSVLSKNKTSGLYDIYRYRVNTLSNGNTMVIFVDISRQLEPLQSFIKISLIVMAVCLLLVFIVIVLISKPVLRPIAESYMRQKRFITDAGHELKTPLTIISANNEIQELETGETECTKIISKQVSRMTTMVKNLTELAKMDEEEKISMQKFSLSDAFIDISTTFENLFAKQGKKLEVHCQNSISYFGTEALIRRLFTLVLENAGKYSLTYATVSLFKKGNHICFTAENDADGVTEGDMSKCFERFYRSEEARSGETEGSGIGLSTAQEIVRLHKGKISAKGTADGKFILTVLL